MTLVDVIAPRRLGTGFRWLLSSSWTSNLGDGVAIAAGPLLVASLTSDPFPVAVAATLRWAPQLVFGLWAGVLADRVDRRRIVLVADLFRAVVLGLVVVALQTRTATVGLVLIAMGLITTAEVFADTSFGALMPMIVRRDDLALANARFSVGLVSLNQLAGPPLGAALFALGRFWPFASQAVLVAAGALLVTKIALPPHGRETRASGAGVRREVADGVRWLVRHPAVRTLALTILIFNVTFGAAWSVLVLYATLRLGLGDLGFGLLTTVSAVGGVLGILGYGWITRRVSLGDIMRVGLVIETLTHLALALTTTPWVAMTVFFVFGAHAFIWAATSTTVRQRAVPTELQGRVGSVYTICVFGGLVAGSGIGGVLAQQYDVTAPFWFAFGGSAVFLLLIWSRLSRIDHEEGPTSGQ